MRQIVLDTETTGLEASQGHRIIEIGCVELFNRRLTGKHYHKYINPQREIDAGAFAVHGISNERLANEPVFAQVAQEFLDYIDGAELIIHNAAFDIGFLNAELNRVIPNFGDLATRCSIIDTLLMARHKHPGQKNNLDALCKRYFVDNSQRELHGALLDSEILADVYLAMTGGQTSLSLGGNQSDGEDGESQEAVRRISSRRGALPIIYATADELVVHEQKLHEINKASGEKCIWLAELGQAQ